MIRFFTITLFILFANSLYSQTSKVENVIAFGAGNTQVDALYNAKLNALDQIFGTFISTTTTILNDSIAINKVISITNGQITNYEVLKTEQTVNGYIVTIRGSANLLNLVSFCKSIGIEAKIQGSLYSDNLSTKLNNRENEIKVLKNFLTTFKTEIPTIFNYDIKLSEPIKASNSDNFLIKVSNNFTLNNNFNSILNVLIDLINQIAIRENELTDYKRNNLEYLPVLIESKEQICYKYLRSKESQKIILEFVKEIDDYLQTHAIIRNDNKEFRPYSRNGSELSFLFYLDNTNWEKYKFFNSEFQPLSIGKLSYKCDPGDENYLTEVIRKKYNFSPCFVLNDTTLKSQKFQFENKVNIETPFFVISSKCALESNFSIQFTYHDWVTVQEMKKVESYTIKK